MVKMSMVASGVWAGEIPIEKAHALKEVGAGGRTMREELESIGYLGEMEASYKAMPIAVSRRYYGLGDGTLIGARRILSYILVGQGS